MTVCGCDTSGNANCCRRSAGAIKCYCGCHLIGDLVDENRDLKSRLAEAERRCANLATTDDLQWMRTGYEEKLAAAEQANAKLREALKPFADAADLLSENVTDDMGLWLVSQTSVQQPRGITVKHVRIARAALEAK